MVDPYSEPAPARRYPALEQFAPVPPAAGQSLDQAGQRPFTRPPAYGLQMKRRSPAGVWLLAIVTLGIYTLVYWYKIHAELAEYDPRRHISPAFELISIFLLGWTIVLPFMSIGGLAGKIRNAQAAAGLPQSCSGLAGILLVFLFGTHLIYYQSKLNEIIAVHDVLPGQPVELRG
jgi:hypothetical protein